MPRHPATMTTMPRFYEDRRHTFFLSHLAPLGFLLPGIWSGSVSVFDVFFDWAIALKLLAKRFLSFIVCDNPLNWNLFAFLWFYWTD